MRLFYSALTGVAIMVLSAAIVSASSGENFVHFSFDSLSIVVASSLAACILSYGDDPLAGLLGGTIVAILTSIIATLDYKLVHPGAYVVGVLLGCLGPSFPARVIFMSFLIAVLFSVIGTKSTVLFFVISGVLGAALRVISQKFAHYLKLPIQKARITRGGVASLVAFVSGYLIIISVFALFYVAAQNFAPDAFKPTTSGAQKLSVSFFFYYSVVTISTLGAPEVVPGHPFSRALVALEVLTGLFWIGIYLALLLQALEKG